MYHCLVITLPSLIAGPRAQDGSVSACKAGCIWPPHQASSSSRDPPHMYESTSGWGLGPPRLVGARRTSRARQRCMRVGPARVRTHEIRTWGQQEAAMLEATCASGTSSDPTMCHCLPCMHGHGRESYSMPSAVALPGVIRITAGCSARHEPSSCPLWSVHAWTCVAGMRTECRPYC